MANKKMWVFHTIVFFLITGVLSSIYFKAKNDLDNKKADFNREYKLKTENLKKLELRLSEAEKINKNKHVRNNGNGSDKMKISNLQKELNSLQNKYNNLKKDKSQIVVAQNNESQTKSTKTKDCNCKEKIKYVTKYKTKIKYKTKVVEKNIPCQTYELDEIKNLQDDFYYFQTKILQNDIKLVCGTDLDGNIAYPYECEKLKKEKQEAMLTLNKIEILAKKNNVSKLYASFIQKSKSSINE